MRSKRDRLDLVKQVFAKRENKLAQEMGQFEAQLDQAVFSPDHPHGLDLERLLDIHHLSGWT